MGLMGAVDLSYDKMKYDVSSMCNGVAPIRHNLRFSGELKGPIEACVSYRR